MLFMDTKTPAQILATALDSFPGVGDSEYTSDEREHLLALAHGKNHSKPTQGHLHRMNYGILANSQVPPSVGQIQTYEYAMPDDQQPYIIDDKTVESKFNRLYEQDKSNSLEDGHSMVIASSASLHLDPQAEIRDIPVSEDERIVIYVCGGGFFLSYTPTIKWYCLRISKELGQRVFIPKYNVAPKHVFPRAVHDVYVACTHLLAQGFKPCNITVSAKSSGGSIAVAALQLLNKCRSVMVDRCILIAPIVDLTMAQDSWISNKDNCILYRQQLTDPKCLMRVYYGDTDVIDPEKLAEIFRYPLLSPLYSSDLSFIPCLQIHVGEHDVLLDDSRQFAQRVSETRNCCHPDETHVELITYPERNHFSIMRGKTQLDKLYGSMRRFLDTP